ncbi:MAG: nucleotidyltransferase domain-containing protein [Firmicutes bacterium]|nr:nucleotidyltransferase domain-containing protein [Bacillota bacterium]
MPVRSLRSCVLKWPDLQTVDQAVRLWAKRMAQKRKDIKGIGCFGSYARGDWGVGSDLDLLIIVGKSEQPFVKRAAEFDVTDLPVPTDVLVYTEKEWQGLDKQGKFCQTLKREAIWVHGPHTCRRSSKFTN